MTAVEVLPDSDRYKCRFKVKSASSNSLYLISYDSAPNANYWTCSADLPIEFPTGSTLIVEQ